MGSIGLLSEDWGESSDFLLAFSANFRPFTSMTVTKSPTCDGGRFLVWFGLASPGVVTEEKKRIHNCKKYIHNWSCQGLNNIRIVKRSNTWALFFTKNIYSITYNYFLDYFHFSVQFHCYISYARPLRLYWTKFR